MTTTTTMTKTYEDLIDECRKEAISQAGDIDPEIFDPAQWEPTALDLAWVSAQEK